MKASRAKVTAVNPTGKHPLHLRAVNAAGDYISGVYGWVDLGTVKKDGDTAAPPPAPSIKVGSRVKVKAGAKSYDGAKIAELVFQNTYTVDELKGDRAVLDLKGICTAFKTSDLILA